MECWKPVISQNICFKFRKSFGKLSLVPFVIASSMNVNYHQICRRISTSTSAKDGNVKIEPRIITSPATNKPIHDIIKISSCIKLHKLKNRESSKLCQPATLVLLFPHLLATAESILRHCSLYHEFGLDVLTVETNPLHLLSPATMTSVAVHLEKYLSSNETPLNTNKFLVHSCSIGNFMYSLLLKEFFKRPFGKSRIQEKVCGQVFDNLMVGNVDSILKDSMKDLASGRTQQNLFGFVSSSCRSAVGNQKFYEDAMDLLKETTIRGSVLVYCSLEDIGLDSETENLLRAWTLDRKMDVSVSCWTRSVHRHHLMSHPVQYQKALEAFIIKLGIM